MTDANTAVSERYLEISNKEKVILILEFSVILRNIAKLYHFLQRVFCFWRSKVKAKRRNSFIEKRFIYTTLKIEEDEDNLQQAVRSVMMQENQKMTVKFDNLREDVQSFTSKMEKIEEKIDELKRVILAQEKK